MRLETAKRSRKPRADSILNRKRLLEAATEIFAAGGPQASLEAVARRAEVGIGTLYRHFPTREALFEAVYRHEVDQLGDLADRLTREADPVGALRAWLHAQVRLVATKKGMIEGLQLAAHGSSELKAYSFERGVVRAARTRRRVAHDSIRRLRRRRAAGDCRYDLRAGRRRLAGDGVTPRRRLRRWPSRK
jgi:AcrR family transcriptional regulator